MAVTSKEDLMKALNAALEETEESLSIIENVNDTLDYLLEKTGEEWKKKYEENDREWRKRYRDRFMNSDTEGSEEEEEEVEEDSGEKSYTYEKLFEEKKGD